jgi:hypothetical protein
MHNPRLVVIFLRIGIAIFFLYTAIASFLQPYSWIGYIPPVLKSLLPEQILVMAFSLFTLALAVWILSGWRTFFAASLSGLTLLVIIAANYTQMDILFRDFTIFMATGALVVSSYPDKKSLI